MPLKIEILIEALKIVAAVAVFFVWVVRYDNKAKVSTLALKFYIRL